MTANAINGDYSSAHLTRVFRARAERMRAEGKDPVVAVRLAEWFEAKVLERPKVIARITPEEPYGVALCDHCDGYRVPNHVCPGGWS